MATVTYESVDAARAAAARSLRRDRKRNVKLSRVIDTPVAPSDSDVDEARKRLKILAASLDR